MNTPFYIARRMGGEEAGNRFTPLIKRIAIISISLGLAVMIVSMAVVTGFQKEIRDKVIGFGGHIQITNFDYNISFEAQPVSSRQDFLEELTVQEGVKHVQVFATKPGIIKTDEDIHGIILKGIGPDFEWSFFSDKLVSGNTLHMTESLRSEGVIISQLIARRMKLELGDDLFMYFIQDPPRVRRLSIEGIYDTGLEELDRFFVLGDIRHIQRLNDWEIDQVGGFEVLVSGFDDIQRVSGNILEIIPYHLDVKSIRDLYPQIFDWLSLLDMNVYVIIVLMIMVAGINMITTLLISVLEKTNTIGILKALGGSNLMIRKVFLYHAGMLITKGLFWGNVTGLFFLVIQSQFGLITLSPESYYVTEVPVNLKISHLLLLNSGTFVISVGMLLVPSYIISRISPARAIIFR
ncbi:MAG: ABC transporter permease [Bacteroidia bacterium]|nr:MAG: ABC transporter permease [Bacteroidia bacterium]